MVAIVVSGLAIGSVGGPALKAWVAEKSAPQQARAYLEGHQVRKVQIGAGTFNYAGWLNTDIEPTGGQVYLNAAGTFPLPDRSVQYIFGEHVIEHLTYEEGLSMLRECYRVLAPGGKVRLATPNLLKYLELFQDQRTEAMNRYIEGKLRWNAWPPTPHPASQVLNGELRSYGHKFVYDPATLIDSLTQAGFERITQFPPGESDDAELRGIESRHRHPALREMNDFETMVLQAVRP